MGFSLSANPSEKKHCENVCLSFPYQLWSCGMCDRFGGADVSVIGG